MHTDDAVEIVFIAYKHMVHKDVARKNWIFIDCLDFITVKCIYFEEGCEPVNFLNTPM